MHVLSDVGTRPKALNIADTLNKLQVYKRKNLYYNDDDNVVDGIKKFV